jgi:hypothetical protein
LLRYIQKNFQIQLNVYSKRLSPLMHADSEISSQKPNSVIPAYAGMTDDFELKSPATAPEICINFGGFR